MRAQTCFIGAKTMGTPVAQPTQRTNFADSAETTAGWNEEIGACVIKSPND
jgi:hypothetical protein